MKKQTAPWIRKALDLLGGGYGSVTKLAEAAGVPPRTAHHWVRKGMRPHGEDEIIRRVAAHLNVPDWWLRDPDLDGEPPPNDAALSEALHGLPRRIVPLVLAALDERKLRWLLEQLKLYERAQREAQSQG